MTISWDWGTLYLLVPGGMTQRSLCTVDRVRKEQVSQLPGLGLAGSLYIGDRIIFHTHTSDHVHKMLFSNEYVPFQRMFYVHMEIFSV